MPYQRWCDALGSDYVPPTPLERAAIENDNRRIEAYMEMGEHSFWERVARQESMENHIDNIIANMSPDDQEIARHKILIIICDMIHDDESLMAYASQFLGLLDS